MKVDTVLILEGQQGLRKSSALAVLGGEWFCDTAIDIANKDSWALVGSKWIFELAEMQTVRGSRDVDALKGFITRREDVYRPPYGRVAVKSPRRAVFVGTTNAAEYLKHDPSGYRRFWPVDCGDRIDLEGLKRDRDQLWAEAVVRLKAGEQWWLTDSEAKLAEAQAEERAEESSGP